MTKGLDIVIGLGAAKCGTTWLHDYMSRHPQCHMRLLKEIYFFGRENGADLAVAARNTSMIANGISRLQGATQDETWKDEFNVVRDLVEWSEYLGHGAANGEAYRAYLGLRHALKPNAKICGDITPAYAGLSDQAFKDMAAMVPDARYVFLMREPVSRFWSNCAHLIRQDRESPDLVALRPNQRSVASMTTAEVGRLFLQGDHFVRSRIARHCNYRETIRKLTSITEPSRIFLGYYETLTDKMQMSRFCAFLGISDVPYDAETRINAGTSDSIPEDVRDAAAAYFADEFEVVTDYSGATRPDEWRVMQSFAQRKR